MKSKLCGERALASLGWAGDRGLGARWLSFGSLPPLNTTTSCRESAYKVYWPGSLSIIMSSAATPVVAELQSANDVPTTQRPLPPAHLFDILPPLDRLLSRLEPSLNVYTTSSSSSEGELVYKDVPIAAQFLKTRISKAQAELAKLDDMDRTADEQAEEIEYLHERIEKQKKVLTDLAALAKNMSNVKHEDQ